jgi:hypothetical protein
VLNEVVPDGQGRALATWTGNDSQLGITSSSAALVRHFDGSGGTLDYTVPFGSSSWFRINPCVTDQQTFSVLFTDGNTYPIGTMSTSRQCVHGISLTVTGNPKGDNKFFTIGSVN